MATDALRLGGDINRTQTQLGEARDELKALQARASIDPDQFDRIKSELEQSRAQITAMRDERDEARSKAKAAVDDKSRIERNATEITERHGDLEQRAAELRQSRDEAQNQLDDARKALERVRADLEESRQAVTELEGMGADGTSAGQVRELQSRVVELEQEVDSRRKQSSDSLGGQGPDRMYTELGEALATIDHILQAMTEMNDGLKGISESVELLASNAEESSSSILEMAAANDEVAESMFNLAASVQQTATSIEEMTFSVKEVAKNIEALSTTAEETSSAMNEMDISIQQVENNANETAQLSEEVVWAAEGGVDAINQTIEVINMIKNSAADAVSVISRLGGRIDEIGTILSVIDDVSEQTNLLALNAAIIAAQAGEHGKGFAVVADEIKDLAERSATSTKEIAEIIKAVQRESRNAVQAVQRSSKSVDDGVRVSHQAEDALKRISDAARRSTQMVREI
ncbi:MAG: chemotaxis protein, partial [Deltaproteobacteria bacterium]|nr:chemotaxis protein [Deltaproteobacteria bacterium]